MKQAFPLLVIQYITAAFWGSELSLGATKVRPSTSIVLNARARSLALKIGRYILFVRESRYNLLSVVSKMSSQHKQRPKSGK